MTEKPKVLAFAGSLREGSFNKKLLRVAVDMMRKAGAEVTVVDLADLDLPIYDGDYEEKHGLPPGGKKLKQLMIDHDAFLIVSPEYNSSITGALKNAIDWASRPEKSDPYYLVAYKGKVAALLSASPGNLGGLRALVHVRDILGNIYTLVIPEQYSLSKANEAFDDEGNLKDSEKKEKVQNVCEKLVDVATKLKKK